MFILLPNNSKIKMAKDDVHKLLTQCCDNGLFMKKNDTHFFPSLSSPPPHPSPSSRPLFSLLPPPLLPPPTSFSPFSRPSPPPHLPPPSYPVRPPLCYACNGPEVMKADASSEPRTFLKIPGEGVSVCLFICLFAVPTTLAS